MIDGPAAEPYQPYPPQLPPPPRPPQNSSASAVFMAVIAAICAIVLVGSATVVAIGLARTHAINPTATSSTAVSPIRIVPQAGGATTPGSATGTVADAASIAARVAPAVVDINSETQNGSAAGTGMILTSSGEVLTNNHVISGATSITVTLTSNQRMYRATVLGADPTADVALLQLQGASGLPTVTVADSSTLSVGQAVIAIGNALGRGGAPSVTTGSITALDQTITASDGNGPGEQLSGLIESDASISPGDSGGPLVNTSGQVIGMITAGQASSRGFRHRPSSTTVGYAITSGAAIAVVNQIRSGSPSSNIVPGSSAAFLGVQVRNIDSATAGQLGLSSTSGALVVGVVAGSPAEQIGLTADSVITALDGHAVASADALGPLIRAHKPGDHASVSWIGGGGTHTRTATLG